MPFAVQFNHFHYTKPMWWAKPDWLWSGAEHQLHCELDHSNPRLVFPTREAAETALYWGSSAAVQQFCTIVEVEEKDQ